MDCFWIGYGLMGGNKIKEIDLNKLIKKRINLIFTTLRNRSDLYKENLINSFKEEILPGFKNEEFKPVIDKIYKFEEINEAHMRMEKNLNKGKIIINLEI
jgi:tumor protein p53-inducible protein 3